MEKKKYVSSQDVRCSYPSWKAQIDRVQNPYSYYVLEPIAFRLAPFFINRGYNANAVTGLSFFLLLCGLMLVTLGYVSRVNVILGSLLLNLVILLDNIDGHVARVTGQVSTFGALCDELVTWVHFSLLPLCLGVGIYYAAPEPSVRGLGLVMPPSVWIAVGVVKMFACLFTFLVGIKVEILLAEQRRLTSMKPFSWLVLAKALRELESPLLILAAASGILSFFFVGYTLYSVGILMVGIGRALQDAARSDQAKLARGEAMLLEEQDRKYV